MLRVFIADDDSIIRQGIRSIIEERVEDCQFAGEAADGNEAYERIKDSGIDLLVTDIKMPVMDGLELIKKIKSSGMNTRIIVLSGFDDYRLVRQAMKDGALDYLLKPVEWKELVALINKVKETIVSELDDLKRTNENSTIMLEHEFKYILRHSGEGTGEDFPARLLKHGIAMFDKYVIAVVRMKFKFFFTGKFTDVKKSVNNDDLRQLLLFKAEEKGIKSRFLTCDFEGNVVVMLTGAGEEDAVLRNKIFNFLQGFGIFISDRNIGSVTAGISHPSKNLGRLHISYHQALLAIHRRFYEYDSNIIFFARENCNFNEMNESELDSQIAQAQNSINLGKPILARNSFERILDVLKFHNLSSDRFRELLTNVLRKLYIGCEDFKNEAENVEELVNFVETAHTCHEISEYLRSAIPAIVERMNIQRHERSKKIIEIVKDYIKKHYNEDISLKAAADMVYLNTTYLSELFKAESGRNFSDYLSETRMEEAKRLLAETLSKVYDIGYAVGYNDPAAFNRAFKKIVGVSPVEYRNLLR